MYFATKDILLIMSLQKLFGQKVKINRLAKGLTQEELAEQIDVSRQTLSQIETGRRWLSANKIERIVKILNIRYVDLFNFRSNINANHELKHFK